MEGEFVGDDVEDTEGLVVDVGEVVAVGVVEAPVEGDDVGEVLLEGVRLGVEDVEGVREGVTDGVEEGVELGEDVGVTDGDTDGVLDGVTEGVAELEGDGVRLTEIDGVTEGLTDREGVMDG